jgi:hypothetical protein
MCFFSHQGLWHHKDFLKFWLGETISAFGSQVTAFALPITAVLTLQATPIQMGLLSFLAFAPMLFLSLFAGVVIDRLPCRLAIPFLILSWFLQSLTLIVFNITQISLRQCLLPQHLQGRLNASMRFLSCSALPVGSLLGGVSGETIGLLPTIILSAIGMSFAFLWILFSPVASLQEQPSLKSC